MNLYFIGLINALICGVSISICVSAKLREGWLVAAKWLLLGGHEIDVFGYHCGSDQSVFGCWTDSVLMWCRVQGVFIYALVVSV